MRPLSVTADDLRAFRTRTGLSQAKAAAALGLHVASVKQYEAGRRWSGGLPAWLAKLCAYYEAHGPI